MALSTVLDDSSEAEYELGVVQCGLRPAGDGGAVREQRGNGTATFELANLTCILLWVGSEDPPLQRLAALRKAFADLRRSL